ncbi:hypothetical protein [Halpernia sp.]|uniref:hypothetical protein n=1 Tax=Halpernia sp. TaxID=2782209 RepID=UPI003A8FD940
MIVRFLKPSHFSGTAKLTVHKTGKLGFSKGAMELLQTKKNRFVRFGFDEKEQLLLEVSSYEVENSFPVYKAGDYDYINAKSMLDDLGVDYAGRDTTIFDLKKLQEKDLYRLIERTIKK